MYTVPACQSTGAPTTHKHTLKLTRAGGNQSVYSTCHPSFGKTCLFALSSVQRLNKHSLAYATYYCFPGFVSTNHSHIRPQMWAGCREFWGWLLMMWCRRVAQVTKHPLPSPPFILWGHYRSHLSAQTSQQCNCCAVLASYDKWSSILTGDWPVEGTPRRRIFYVYVSIG